MVYKGFWMSMRLWEGKGLKPTEKIVLQALALKKAERGYVLSYTALAYMCDISVDTVTKAIKKLEELGYLKRTKEENKTIVTLAKFLFDGFPQIPTKEEVKEYCEKKGYDIDVDAFYAYNERRGWRAANKNDYTWRYLTKVWRNKTAKGRITPEDLSEEEKIWYN